MQTDVAALLTPLADLLAAFNHRHKNQHRRSAWWAHFNHLRRAVRRLLASSGPGAKPQKPTGGDRLGRRARWAADHVVPPSYVAFTQLTADNQFAPLGLLLLGALARFHAAISLLLPPAPMPLPAAAADRAWDLATKRAVPASSASAPDLGESISRDEFAPAAPRETKEASLEGDGAAPSRVRAAATPDASAGDKGKDKDKVKKKKKKKAAAGTDLRDLFGSLA